MNKKWILLILLFLIMPGTVLAKETIPILPNGLSMLVASDNKIIEKTDKNSVTKDSYVSCAEDIYIPYQIVSVLRTFEMFIKIGVPILFIIMGMIDFGKVVIGKPDEEMKKTKKAFSSRLITAVFVFLVVNIVEMVLPIIGAEDRVLNCTKCIILDDNNCNYMNITYPTSSPVVTPKPTSTSTPTPTPTPTPTAVPTPSPRPTVTPTSTPEVTSTITPES